MKKIVLIVCAGLLVLAGCGGPKTESDEEIIDIGASEEVTEETEETGEEATEKIPQENAWDDIDMTDVPQKEEGERTQDEDFAELPDELEASHVSDNFTMILNFYFEDGKAVNGYVTGIYKNEAQAKVVYDSYVKNTEYYANVRRDGGKITYVNTEEGFEAYKGKTKEEVKDMCLEGGFEITKE